MAGTIKGITVEIGGNTAPLDNALKGVNKTSRDLQSELKQVEKLLKLDPTNTELLAQKQKLLSQSIENTSGKLNTLKEAEKQVQEQVKQGKVSEEQYRAFQREISKTAIELNKLQDQSAGTTTGIKTLGEETGKASKEMDGLQETSGKATDLLKGAGAAVGGLVVATGGTAIKSIGDLQTALNGLSAKTGATAEETDGFRETLLNIYSNNYGEGFDDIAEAMENIYQQTGQTNEQLQETSQYALTLRDTFGFEVNESIRSANMLMQQFGLSSKEAYNLITQGAQNGLDKNGDLLDTINEYSVQFKGLGLSADEMFTMLANGANGGTFSVDKLGDAVKEFGIRAKDGSSTTIQAYKTLGLNTDEMTKKFAEGGEKGKEAFNQVVEALFSMEDPVAQNTTGVNLFGSMWEDLGKAGVKALTDTNIVIDQTNDKLGEIQKVKYNDPISALKGLGRTIETDVLVPLGEKLLPKINEAIDAISSDAAQNVVNNLSDAIAGIINFLLDNGPTIISIIGGIGTALLAWDVASMINNVVKSIKTFQAANEGATIAQWALNVAMSANPIGIIVSIIAGLVAATILLWNTNEDFRNGIINIWENIKSAVSTAIEAVKGAFNTVIDFIQNNWQGLLLLIVNPFAGAFKLLYDNCGTFRTFVDGFVENVKNAFINFWNNVVSFFTESVPQWLASMIGWFNQLPYNLGLAIGQMIGSIIQFGVDVVNWVTNDLPGIINSIINWFSELPGNIESFFKNILTNIGQWGIDTIDWINIHVTEIIDTIVNFFSGLPDKVWNAITGIIDKLTDIKNNMVNWCSEQLPGFIDSFVSWMEELPQRMLDIGSDIVSGIWEGITNMKDWLMGKVSEFTGGIVDGIKNKLQIHSPSRVLADEVGKYMAQGIGVGFEDEMSSVSMNMAKAIPTTPQSYSDSAKSSSTASTAINSVAEMTLNIPLNMDGKNVSNVVSKIQYNNGKIKVRALGV